MKATAKHELLLRGGFVEHLSLTSVAQQSVAEIISLTIMNLVTPKVGAKHELLLNKPALANRPWLHLKLGPIYLKHLRALDDT
jgi:hypothetical protein